MSAAARKGRETLGPEGRRAAARKGQETLRQLGAARKGHDAAAALKRQETMGPEGLSAAVHKANRTLGPEGLSVRGTKTNASRQIIQAQLLDEITTLKRQLPNQDILRSIDHLWPRSPIFTKKLREYRNALRAIVCGPTSE